VSKQKGGGGGNTGKLKEEYSKNALPAALKMKKKKPETMSSH